MIIVFRIKINLSQIGGKLTLQENVADTEGVKLAFKVMQQYFEDNPIHREDKLPGLEDLNAEKLYFISFANVSILK